MFAVIASRRRGLLRKRKAVGYLGRSPFRELISHLTWQMVSATRRIAESQPALPVPSRLSFIVSKILPVESGFYENSSNRYRAYISQGFPKDFPKISLYLLRRGENGQAKNERKNGKEEKKEGKKERKKERKRNEQHRATSYRERIHRGHLLLNSTLPRG